MTRNWVVVATFVGGLVACSGSKDKPASGSAAPTTGGSAGSAGSAAAKEPPSAVSGIPAGPITVTLPTAAAAHARAVTSATTFVTIDAKGAIAYGKLVAGATPYAGTKHERTGVRDRFEDALKALTAPAVEGAGSAGSGSAGSGSAGSGSAGSDSLMDPPGSVHQTEPGGGVNLADQIASSAGIIAPIVDHSLHGRIAGAGPIDTLVLADSRVAAGVVINTVGGFEKRRIGLAVVGPNGIARLDLLMIDRWGPPADTVRLRLSATQVIITPSDTSQDPIPVAELGPAMTRLVSDRKGAVPFVELTVAKEISVATLVATLATIVETGVVEIDIRTDGAEGTFEDVFGEGLYAPDDGSRGAPEQQGFAARPWKSNWVSVPIEVKLAGEPNNSDRNMVKRYLRQRTAQTRACYDTRLKAKPTLAGKSTAKFVIAAAGGAAAKLTVKGLDKVVDACLADTIRQIQFPATANKASLVVEATFTFSSAVDPNDPLGTRR